MSLVSLLGIARSALKTHQRSVEVTSHNIANASTPGYTRQRADLQPETPFRTPFGTLGRGVTIDNVYRMRDQFLDARYRQESAAHGRFTELRDQLGQLEAVLGEPSEFGLAATLDAFWSSWSDLANSPTSTAARAVVRNQGEAVARAFNGLDNRFSEIAQNTAAQLADAVGAVNALAREIAGLNSEIVSAEANGQSANDLRDRRDVAIDQLSGMLPTRVVEQPNGSAMVVIGDLTFVDGSTALPLTVEASGRGIYALRVEGIPGSFTPDSGRISALTDTLSTGVPDLRQQIDAVAAAVVSEVNALHRTGVTLTGGMGRDFFAAAGLTAGTMSLAVLTQSSIHEIAAGVSGQAGDGSLALALAGLRDVGAGSLGGRSIHDLYVETVTSLGSQVRDADRLAQSQEALLGNVETRRASANGVSIDEEMVDLISHQQAYTAAARIVTVADEMVQTILNMV
jgi:flagellar hook-associated protein 1 FlgK